MTDTVIQWWSDSCFPATQKTDFALVSLYLVMQGSLYKYCLPDKKQPYLW